MRFCFVDRVNAQAIWRVMGPVASALVAQGHQVDFVRFKDREEMPGFEIPDKVQVVDIPVPTKKTLLDLIKQQIKFSKDFGRYLTEKKPDVVHTHFAVPSIAARWVAFRKGIPFIVSTQHDMYQSMRFHYRWGTRFTDHYCSAITYISNTVARSFGQKGQKVQHIDWNHNPVHAVILNGVDVMGIRKAISNSLDRVSGKIVCAGRMVPVKGQWVLLSALRRVIKLHPQVKLLLIGAGPMEEELKRLTHEWDLSEFVEFTGWFPHHDQVLREMASAELVVVPSTKVPGTVLHEGFGLVVAEALICGSPLLVSDIPVFHEVLDPFPGRFHFFTEGDSNALATEMNRYFSGDLSYRPPPSPLSVEDEAWVSADTMAENYLGLYQGLFQRRAL
jgi:glycosyltransferase involved in cell wall biosynthesis